jgi:hypothetical protein
MGGFIFLRLPYFFPVLSGAWMVDGSVKDLRMELDRAGFYPPGD